MEEIAAPRLLEAGDETQDFDCGVDVLNEWLKNRSVNIYDNIGTHGVDRCSKHCATRTICDYLATGIIETSDCCIRT